MLDQVLPVFGVVPDYELDAMRPGQSLTDITARLLSSIQGVLEAERPDVVIVQGDTTTVFCASLAAFFAKVPVAHVEAGLRTRDKRNPFPEEAFRRMADVLADTYFAPTTHSRDNLLGEGVAASSVFVTGNTVVDALYFLDNLLETTSLGREVRDRFRKATGVDVESRRTILVTGHRRESFGPGIEGVCAALAEIAAAYPDVQILYPAHLNPNVQDPVWRLLGSLDRVHIVPPQDYQTFVWLMKACYLVVTDSGGIQEEAPYLGKPVLVTRASTERPEAIEAGTSRLVGTDTASIVRAASELLDSRAKYDRMAQAASPFGDGTASRQIVDVLLERHSPLTSPQLTPALASTPRRF
jgi:UDP-N-acetylglucosamine 2-epimerase